MVYNKGNGYGRGNGFKIRNNVRKDNTQKLNSMKNKLGKIELRHERWDECEWCFQFDEDEPHVFAWTNEGDKNEKPEITFTLSNVKGSNIHFKHSDGKVFKLFARELTDIGREKRKLGL